MITLDSINYQTASIQVLDNSGHALVISAGGAISVLNDFAAASGASLPSVLGVVAGYDGTAVRPVSVAANGFVNVNAAQAGYGTWQAVNATATTSATQLAASPLSGRLRIEIENVGNNDIFLGATSGVTTANGLKVARGASYDQALSAAASIFVITSGGTSDVRIAEYAA